MLFSFQITRNCDFLSNNAILNWKKMKVFQRLRHHKRLDFIQFFSQFNFKVTDINIILQRNKIVVGNAKELGKS